jgi:hypothetical protein
MKPSSVKAKGRNAENGLVTLLQASGWPYAERRRQSGTKDRGDITGIPKVVLEVKSGARIDLPGWLRETEVERVNDRAIYGALVIKLKGMGEARVGEWPVMLPLSQFLRLLREAGYGAVPLEDPPGEGSDT